MSKRIEMKNKKFGRLTVESEHPIRKNNEICWVCKCDCGNEIIVQGYNLRSGNTQSCGCLKKEKIINSISKHHLSNSRLYIIWKTMKQRCYNSKSNNFKHYGGKGVTIFNNWIDKENGFTNFYNWSIENGYLENLTIDRIDVNGNYEPSNCRWVTIKEQENNKSNNHLIKDIDGNYLTVSQFKTKYNMKTSTLLNRLYSGDLGYRLIRPKRSNKNNYANNWNNLCLGEESV